MLRAGFETSILGSDRSLTHALDLAATGISRATSLPTSDRVCVFHNFKAIRKTDSSPTSRYDFSYIALYYKEEYYGKIAYGSP
jgi:hypothetical protein